VSMSYSLRKGRDGINFIVPLLFFAVLLLLATWKHTFWRDESEVWLVARISPSIRALLHNSRYEGHPPLWYLVVYFFTRFSWNPDWMKLPNYLCAVASAALILSADRLRLWVRLGMTFSYYLLFEYGLIARNYMIGIVFLLAAAILMRRKDPKHAAIPIFLSLAALTSLPALIVAMSLGLLYLWFVFQNTKDRTVTGLAAALGLKGLLGIAVFVISALISAATIRPPADSSLFLESSVRPHGLIAKLAYCIHLFTQAYLPIPQWSRSFWNSSLLNHLPFHLEQVLGAVLIVGFLCYFRDAAVRTFFVALSAIELLQLAVSGRDTQRHIGWLFIVLILALLLDRSSLVDSNDPRVANQIAANSTWRNALLAVVLAAQVITGLFAIAVSIKFPFSRSKEVAAYLRQQHLDQAPLAFEPFYVGESVLAYLQRASAYSPDEHKEMSFVLWDKDEYFGRRPAPIPEEFHALARGGEAPVLITDKPLSPAQMAALNVRLLVSFDDAISSMDRYFIYR
jgi:hypothetical protein